VNTSEPMAKSDPPITLRRHTEEVVEAVSALLAALEKPLSEITSSTFSEMMRVAAFFHDLGKAAYGFQEVVTYQGDGQRPRWDYRHEALSAAILLATGLEAVCDPYLFAAVVTHHKTLDHQSLIRCTGRGLPRFVFEKTTLPVWKKRLEELRPWWEWVRQYVAEAERNDRIPRLPNSLPDDPTSLPDLYAANQHLESTLKEVRDLRDTTIFWVLARGLLMGGDHLASARLGTLLTHLSALKIRPPEGYQQRVQAVNGPVLLEAPTGSGKTEAALHWAMANRRGGERIFYILPYQASINKMSERLEDLFGQENVGILHHRAALQEFHRHFDAEADNYEEASQKAKKRTEDTRQFYRPVKIMTPYQMLKLMFGCRFFEIGLSELLGGLVIFDEIHAYDPHVAALIEIMVERLHALKVRFLFMTATFPDFLKERLQKALHECSTLSVERDHERDIRLLDTARHTLHIRSSTLEALADDIVADAATKKVLVVCNRVDQAQALYMVLKDRVPSISLLHSRFISKDRSRKENELIAFPDDNDPVRQQIPAASVLIATQVVEVSLNVSFDTIYTEIAPVDALLQRFGRVNRLNQHGKPVPVYVAALYDVEAVQYVYSTERIELTLKHAPNGQELYPAIENHWVRDTYADGYTQKEQEKYKLAHIAFDEIVRRLQPYYTGDDRDFYELFDNYNVVPIRFAHLYKQAIAEKRFFEAAGYVASISTPTFKKMKDWSEEDKENHIYYMDRRYDGDLGLLNQQETDRTFREEAFNQQCF